MTLRSMILLCLDWVFLRNLNKYLTTKGTKFLHKVHNFYSEVYYLQDLTSYSIAKFIVFFVKKLCAFCGL